MTSPVARWLETFMCKQYEKVFEAYGYKTLQSVCQLDRHQLGSMGILPEHVEKIAENISVLRQSFMSKGSQRTTGSTVCTPTGDVDPLMNPASTALMNMSRKREPVGMHHSNGNSAYPPQHPAMNAPQDISYQQHSSTPGGAMGSSMPSYQGPGPGQGCEGPPHPMYPPGYMYPQHPGGQGVPHNMQHPGAPWGYGAQPPGQMGYGCTVEGSSMPPVNVHMRLPRENPQHVADSILHMASQQYRHPALPSPNCQPLHNRMPHPSQLSPNSQMQPGYMVPQSPAQGQYMYKSPNSMVTPPTVMSPANLSSPTDVVRNPSPAAGPSPYSGSVVPDKSPPYSCVSSSPGIIGMKSPTAVPNLRSPAPYPLQASPVGLISSGPVMCNPQPATHHPTHHPSPHAGNFAPPSDAPHRHPTPTHSGYMPTPPTDSPSQYPVPHNQFPHPADQVTAPTGNSPHPQQPNNPHPQQPNNPHPQRPNNPQPQQPNNPHPHPQQPNNPHPQQPNNPHPQQPNNPHPQQPNNPHPQQPNNPHPQQPNNPHPQQPNNPHTQQRNPHPQQPNNPHPQQPNPHSQPSNNPHPQPSNNPHPQPSNNPHPQQPNNPQTQQPNLHPQQPNNPRPQQPNPHQQQPNPHAQQPNNPLMSLQKLVMQPENDVVDPKSVVSDVNLGNEWRYEGNEDPQDRPGSAVRRYSSPSMSGSCLHPEVNNMSAVPHGMNHANTMEDAYRNNLMQGHGMMGPQMHPEGFGSGPWNHMGHGPEQYGVPSSEPVKKVRKRRKKNGTEGDPSNGQAPRKRKKSKSQADMCEQFGEASSFHHAPGIPGCCDSQPKNLLGDTTVSEQDDCTSRCPLEGHTVSDREPQGATILSNPDAVVSPLSKKTNPVESADGVEQISSDSEQTATVSPIVTRDSDGSITSSCVGECGSARPEGDASKNVTISETDGCQLHNVDIPRDCTSSGEIANCTLTSDDTLSLPVRHELNDLDPAPRQVSKGSYDVKDCEAFSCHLFPKKQPLLSDQSENIVDELTEEKVQNDETMECGLSPQESNEVDHSENPLEQESGGIVTNRSDDVVVTKSLTCEDSFEKQSEEQADEKSEHIETPEVTESSKPNQVVSIQGCDVAGDDGAQDMSTTAADSCPCEEVMVKSENVSCDVVDESSVEKIPEKTESLSTEETETVECSKQTNVCLKQGLELSCDSSDPAKESELKVKQESPQLPCSEASSLKKDIKSESQSEVKVQTSQSPKKQKSSKSLSSVLSKLYETKMNVKADGISDTSNCTSLPSYLHGTLSVDNCFSSQEKEFSNCAEDQKINVLSCSNTSKEVHNILKETVKEELTPSPEYEPTSPVDSIKENCNITKPRKKGKKKVLNSSCNAADNVPDVEPCGVKEMKKAVLGGAANERNKTVKRGVDLLSLEQYGRGKRKRVVNFIPKYLEMSSDEFDEDDYLEPHPSICKVDPLFSPAKDLLECSDLLDLSKKKTILSDKAIQSVNRSVILYPAARKDIPPLVKCSPRRSRQKNSQNSTPDRVNSLEPKIAKKASPNNHCLPKRNAFRKSPVEESVDLDWDNGSNNDLPVESADGAESVCESVEAEGAAEPVITISSSDNEFIQEGVDEQMPFLFDTSSRESMPNSTDIPNQPPACLSPRPQLNDMVIDLSVPSPSSTGETKEASVPPSSPKPPESCEKKVVRNIPSKDTAKRRRKKVRSGRRNHFDGYGSDQSMEEVKKTVDRLNNAHNKRSSSSSKSKFHSIGPHLKVHGPKDAPTSCELRSEPDSNKMLKKSKKPEAFTDSTSCPSTVNFEDCAPFSCAFCGHGSNYKCLGDLFGPYHVDASARVASTQDRNYRSPSRDPRKRRKSSHSGGSPSRRTDRLSGEVWLHEDCIVWTNGVFNSGGHLLGLEEALLTSDNMWCSVCGSCGSSLGCLQKGCQATYHYLCALDAECYFDHENLSLLCPNHKDRTTRMKTGNS